MWYNLTCFVEQIEALTDSKNVGIEDVTLDEEKIIFITLIGSKQLSLTHPNVTFTKSNSNNLRIKGTKHDRNEFIKHLQNVRFYCEPLTLSPWVIKYLSTNSGKALLKMCQKGYESTTVTLTKNNKLYIISAIKSTIIQLSSTIGLEVGQKELKAPTQFKGMCHNQSWISFCDRVHSTHSVLIGVSPTEDQVIIAGDTTHLAASAKIVEKFIADECYGKERVSLKRGQWKYVSHHAMLKWSKLLSKAEENSVSVLEPNEDDKNPTITMEGDPAAIQKILEELNKLITSICTTPMEITRPGTIRFLLSEGGQIMINGIEAQHRSCIQLTVDTQGQASQSSKMATSTINSNEKCKATTEEGKLITLAIGDITEYPVDVIVNAADIKLDHADGVAAAIVRKGGRIIQEESKRLVQNEGELFYGDAVMMKEVGKLPCQRLIHAVGPRWQSGNRNEEAILRNACMESLNLANNYRSIAFPAISGGIYGFPAAVCAHSMIEEFITWSQRNGIAALHDIHVIVNDPTLVNAFTEEMRKNERCRVLPDFQKSANADNSASNSKGTPTGSAKCKRLANNTSIAPDNHTPLLTEDSFIVPSQQFQPETLNQMPTDSPSAMQRVRQYNNSLPDNAVLHIQIFAGSTCQVDTTKFRVLKVIHDRFKADVIENDDRVSKLSKQQISDLEEKAKAFQVEIRFEPHLKRIRLKGEKEDVDELKTQIMNYFDRIAIKEGNRFRQHLRGGIIKSLKADENKIMQNKAVVCASHTSTQELSKQNTGTVNISSLSGDVLALMKKCGVYCGVYQNDHLTYDIQGGGVTIECPGDDEGATTIAEEFQTQYHQMMLGGKLKEHSFPIPSTYNKQQVDELVSQCNNDYNYSIFKHDSENSVIKCLSISARQMSHIRRKFQSV